MSGLVGPDGKPVVSDKQPAEHENVKVFMNPIDAVRRAMDILQRNQRDRAFRIERDVLESLVLGLCDYAQQIKALKDAQKPEDAGVSDDSAKPVEEFNDPSQ